MFRKVHFTKEEITVSIAMIAVILTEAFVFCVVINWLASVINWHATYWLQMIALLLIWPIIVLYTAQAFGLLKIKINA
jgi:hypothetical protein